MGDGRFQKGLIPWNKKEGIIKTCKCGKIFQVKPSLDRVQSCSISCGQKGKVGPRKGMTLLPELKEKMRVSKLTWKARNPGKHHWNWIEDRTLLKDDSKERGGQFHREWSRQVKNRDKLKCRIANNDCFGRIEAHHILGWKSHPELRYNINNGITLCHAHHPRKMAEVKRLEPILQALVSEIKDQNRR